MRITIVGGGITGLTAGYQLSKAGHQVTIFEKENYLGGLAAGFKRKNWLWNLEYFFHHFFVSDYSAKKLIKELGLSQKLFFLRPKTSIFKNNQISQFDSFFSVLRFPHLSLSEKLRTGLVTSYLKGKNNWREFEKTTAKNWLTKFYGKRPYQILWQPLLEGKFGQDADCISMAWFWARIKKRSQKLGYLRGGFQVLIERLAEKIKENQGKILLNFEVKDLNEIDNWRKFDRIIITTPTLMLGQVKFLGALNLILILKEKFLTDNTYWLNINEKSFPFVVIVEHTNFVTPQYYGGDHLVYLGGYYPSDHHYFQMNKEEILREFLPYLQKISPSFNFQFSIFNFQLASNRYAQPVIPTNYAKIMPKMRTPIKNLYLANQSLIYPWDRGVDQAIELGEKVAKRV